MVILLLRVYHLIATATPDRAALLRLERVVRSGLRAPSMFMLASAAVAPVPATGGMEAIEFYLPSSHQGSASPY
jgi:hypothetical protein